MNDGVSIDEIDKLISEKWSSPKSLVELLHAIRIRYGWLPETALRRICEKTGTTPDTVSSVASFYPVFRTRPAGKHYIRVCIGTACHVKGAEKVFEMFKQYLGIPENEDTDSEHLFTVEKVACLGCCMLAPAVQIDELVYGLAEPSKVPAILADFLENRTVLGDMKYPVSSVKYKYGEVRLCHCTSCTAAGAAKTMDEFATHIQNLNLPVELKSVSCTGASYLAPLVEIIMRDGSSYRYGKVTSDRAREILLRHFKPTKLTRRLRASVLKLLERVAEEPYSEPVIRFPSDIRDTHQLYHLESQKRIATEYAGEMSPLDISDYIAHGGFDAFKRCVSQLTPDDIINCIKKSGLRGRGGAGYPTGKKWAAVRNASDTVKFVVGNGDEGDPGAFMDRIIMESTPFRVIEGMLIAGRAVGAEHGILYIRNEYPLALHRIREAIEICKKHGLLGNNILGSDMRFDLQIVEGGGAFVCGEETALISAIEGKRPMPRLRPPYPAQTGLYGRPTLVNNVETFAVVPWILTYGAEKFASLGTETSKGTKTFALAGKIRHGGLIEVPMGMTLRDIIFKIGRGIQNDRQLKAVLIGGPSGGCLPASLIDVPIDYEDLLSYGAMMGSGGMVVLDETDCMVEIARYFMSFTQRESCGKCAPCRIGTKRMLELLEQLCEGKGSKDTIVELERTAHLVKKASLCGLGKTAPNPVLTTLSYFRDEYIAHAEQRCPAGRCKALITYYITDDCIGCTRCAQRCPADAIEIRPHQKHEIDVAKCTRCDTCKQACPVGAVLVK